MAVTESNAKLTDGDHFLKRKTRILCCSIPNQRFRKTVPDQNHLGQHERSELVFVNARVVLL